MMEPAKSGHGRPGEARTGPEGPSRILQQPAEKVSDRDRSIRLVVGIDVGRRSAARLVDQERRDPAAEEVAAALPGAEGSANGVRLGVADDGGGGREGVGVGELVLRPRGGVDGLDGDAEAPDAVEEAGTSSMPALRASRSGSSAREA